MRVPFQLEWQGGAAERLFRRARPLDDLPWESLDPSRLPADLVARARIAWTEGAISEYASAASFAALLRDLCEARAPIDLIGMAGTFVADEMLHTELNARMAMVLGGASPVGVDFERIVVPVDETTSPFTRAVERAVRLCCVGEALSVPLLAGTHRAASHPLTRAVLDRIVKDEPPHAALGWLVLEWADDRLDDAARTRLVDVAVDAAAAYAPDWQVAREPHRFEPHHVAALGWMEPTSWRAAAGRAVRSIESRLVASGLPAHGFAARVGIT